MVAPAISEQTPPQAAETAAPAKSTFLQRNSLRLAGILNLIGDVGFLGGGLKGKDHFKTTGGALYTLGGLNLTLFGRVKTEEKLNIVTQDTAAFIEQQTGHAAANLSAQMPSAASKENALYRSAAQNTLYAYTLGAAAVLISGIKKYRADSKQWAGLVYGISSLVFKLTSLMIPEKSIKETGNEKKGGFVNWVREKPLRIFGYGSLITDTALGIQSYQEYKHNPGDKGYGWTALTTVTYMLADFMIARSNKDPANAGGKLSAEEQRRVETLAAEAIAREPKEAQDALLIQVAAFLSERPEINGKADALATSLKQKVAAMDSSQWTSRVKIDNAPALQPAR